MVDVRGAIITVLRALFISSGEMIIQGLVLLISLPIVGSSSIKKYIKSSYQVHSSSNLLLTFSKNISLSFKEPAFIIISSHPSLGLCFAGSMMIFLFYMDKNTSSLTFACSSILLFKRIP